MSNRLARLFGDAYPYIKADIFCFCKLMNFTPTWQQEQLLGCVQRGDLKLAVKSGKGPGKSTTTVLVALWRCLQNVGALTLLTAPTMRQCRDVWLAEARRLMEKADPLLQHLIKVTQTKIIIAGSPQWGVLTVTANKVENAMGYHQKNMSIIAEEASGIKREIMQAFKDTATNPGCLFIQIGNPTNRDCSFFDCFHGQRSEWTGITWNAEETPESEWFTAERNRSVEREFGRNSDIYRIAVLGEFPLTDPECVMGTEDVQKCMDRSRMRNEALRAAPDGRHARQFGIDYARFGGDENTVYRRSGEAIVQKWEEPHVEPYEAMKRAFKMQKDAGWSDDQTIFVADAGGIGQGVIGRFYEHNKRCIEFHNGGKATNSRQFENRITEAWFNVASKVKKGIGYFPEDTRLLEQLTTRRYYPTIKGTLKIESKDDYKDRGHNSPDRADGVVLAMYDKVAAVANLAGRENSKRTVGDVR